MPEETELSDWQESAEEARKTPGRTMKDILSAGCGRRVGDTGNVVVHCQNTHLCSQCDAKLIGFSKGQLAGIIQDQEKTIQKLRKQLSGATTNKHRRLGYPPSSRRSRG